MGPNMAAAADARDRLRRNLVGNVVREYHRTGFLWENYDDVSGAGRGTHPFTGWTALFLLA